MKTATPLRGLTPGAAWNDALRRSLAISIAGFFLPNLFAEFGAVPQLHQTFHFLLGICGAAGACLASLALFMGITIENQFKVPRSLVDSLTALDRLLALYSTHQSDSCHCEGLPKHWSYAIIGRLSEEQFSLEKCTPPRRTQT
jgi:hypothetical protein